MAKSGPKQEDPGSSMQPTDVTAQVMALYVQALERERTATAAEEADEGAILLAFSRGALSSKKESKRLNPITELTIAQDDENFNRVIGSLPKPKRKL